MAVPRDVLRGQVVPRHVHAGDLQVRHGAVVVGGVIARLARQEQYRDAGQVDELPRGVRLLKARHETGVRRGDVDGGYHGGVAGDRRVVGQRQRAGPVGAREALLWEYVHERRACARLVSGFRRLSTFPTGSATFGLEGHNGLDERRVLVGDAPAEQPALRVRHQDHGLADALQQRGAGGAVHGLGLVEVGEGLHLGRVEGVEDGVAEHAGAGPLRVQVRLRPAVVVLRGREEVLGEVDAELAQRRLGRQPGGAAAVGLLDEVDLVALAQEVRGPALAVVGRVEEVLRARSARLGRERRWGRLYGPELLEVRTVPVCPAPGQMTIGYGWVMLQGSSCSTYIWSTLKIPWT